jgi:hypothetical protein
LGWRQKGGTSSEIMRWLDVRWSGGLAPFNGKSRPPWQRDSNVKSSKPRLSASSRTRAVGTRFVDRFHRLGRLDPRGAVVRVFPHLRRKSSREVGADFRLLGAIIPPIWFVVFPETRIAHDDPGLALTIAAAASPIKGSASDKVFRVKNHHVVTSRR